MPDREEILSKVTTSLVDALGVDEEEVSLEASLTEDLGAESIDFLDIVFRLEKAFGIKIPRGDLFPENLLSSPEYVKDGKLTEGGLAVLREKMPYANLDQFRQNPLVSELGRLFTVGMIVNYVADRLKSQAA
jgi:acyl carrier protein